MITDLQGTIITLATAEFAAHGLSGASVDRTARRAGCPPAQIYRLFDSKQGLFDAAVTSAHRGLAAEAPRLGESLADHAAALFDLYQDRPQPLALVMRARMTDDEESERLFPPFTSADPKNIEKAQAGRLVSSDFKPDQLLRLVDNLAATWASGHGGVTRFLTRAELREALIDFVAHATMPKGMAA